MLCLQQIKAFISRLPPEATLYKHVFKPFKARDDVFFCKLFVESCKQNISWSKDDLGDVLHTFVSGKRSLDVFTTWLNLPSTNKLLEAKSIQIWPTSGQHPTFVCALVHLNRYDLLEELQSKLEGNPDLEVSHTKISLDQCLVKKIYYNNNKKTRIMFVSFLEK